MSKLHAVIAVHKGGRSAIDSRIVSGMKEAAKAEPYAGLVRQYHPFDEAGEKQPEENKRVQRFATAVLTEIRGLYADLIASTARIDYANTQAKADVVVNGTILVTGVPVTHLLFLEKRLAEIRDFVNTIPTLDPSEDWQVDPSTQGGWRTLPRKTNSTKKTQRGLILVPATDKHPAQAQLVTEDVTVGQWETVKQSGALDVSTKVALLARITTLIKAVKEARSVANMTEAPEITIADPILGFIFNA